MKSIILIKNDKEVKQFRIEDAFMADGFRILIDYLDENRPIGSFTNADGSFDEVFKTEDEAFNRAIKYANNCLKVKGHSSYAIDGYIVKEVERDY